MHNRTVIKVLTKYSLRIVPLLLFVNIIIAFSLHFRIIASSCLTKQQVQSDNRCLYIWGNQIYEKADRSNPHYGHPCGSDITSIIPASHVGNQARYLLPNYIANICAAATPTPTSTPTPQPTATPTPTITPKPTPTFTPTPTMAMQMSVTATPTTAVRSTVTPSPTTVPITQAPTLNNPIVNLAVKLDGISTTTTIPLQTTRNATLLVYNPTDTISNSSISPVFTVPDILTYDTSSSSATSKLFIDPQANLISVAPGQYQLAIKINGYIQKQVIDTTTGSTLFTVSNGQVTTLPVVSLLTGDINGDNILDIKDYNLLISCYGDKAQTSSCTNMQAADLDDNGVIDGIDYNIFLSNLRDYLVMNNIISPISPSPSPSPVITLTLTPTATPTATITAIPTIIPVSYAPVISSTMTPSPIFPTTIAEVSTTIEQPLVSPQPTKTQSFIETMVASAKSSVWWSKVLDFIIFLVLIIVLLIGIVRSKVLKNVPLSKKKILDNSIPVPAGKIKQPSFPKPSEILTEGMLIDKTFYVKPYQPDQNNTAMWVLLTEGDTKIMGYCATPAVSEGFAKIKGIVKSTPKQQYIAISEITSVQK